MPKEKSLNPVAAHHKAQKKASVKKNKAVVQAQRQDRLSKRDPARLERQIASLQSLSSSGALKPRDKDTLAALERDLAAVRKARERAGVPEREHRDYREERGERERKRRRTYEDEGDETDPEVRGIPMPRDTPPPVPRAGVRGRDGEKKEPVEARITYSSAPVMRDLKAAATGKGFAPAQVRRNMDKVKGKGGLVEEEEWERLERAGYQGSSIGGGTVGGKEEGGGTGPKGVVMEEVEDEDA
ncbi:hypothetical protein K461DRAFT_263999 [Myriangium duriaei CBS 260.36]|uniref:Wbp11/ELF5/Saf1 N-terminal domain-containing protein n=1 Tax=Myriangium duriaei CBS 260.36 TaxID=1168546 RepID=A0A9P4ML64_9PEZI|nr:hypothetical protein K461DRAFT_263999 [Myriangium duriaei CBS 260.36]